MIFVVLIFGIVFLTLSLKLNKPVPENYEKAEAAIIRIEEELSPVYDASDGIGADDYDHRVFVEYTYKGKTYSDKEYANYNSSMKEGDTVLVYINPDKPEEFISDPSGNFIFVIIGIVIILVGAGGIGYNIYKKKRG
ncbi:MAG: DUF3592 domain-containing protein [Clostridia bacterium]|nr:DUF3592 domain-containing protein [Clostridia bacterium]